MLLSFLGVPFGTVARRLTVDAVRILMYHRFAARDSGRALGSHEFEQQLSYVRRHCSLLHLSELAARLKSGAELPPRPAV